jgi:hypothetical protein
MFKFELGWLFREGFMDIVRDIWTHTVGGCTHRWKDDKGKSAGLDNICEVRQKTQVGNTRRKRRY